MVCGKTGKGSKEKSFSYHFYDNRSKDMCPKVIILCTWPKNCMTMLPKVFFSHLLNPRGS